MRKLIIMQGLPASGKSELIRDNFLEQYTLSTDTIRRMISSHQQDYMGDLHLAQDNNTRVFEILHTLLDERMATGSDTIIDATHCSNKKQFQEDVKKYKDLAKKYKYKLYVCRLEVDVNEVLRNNATRKAFKIVPTQVIRKMNRQMKDCQFPKDFIQIGPDDLKQVITNNPLKEFEVPDLYKMGYSEVRVIGSPYSCATVLKEALGEYRENIFYIFTGGYFGKGIEHIETWDILQSYRGKKNVVFLEGVSELAMAEYAHNATGCGYYRLDEYQQMHKVVSDLSKISSPKTLAKEMRVWWREMKPYFAFKFDEKPFLTSHGIIAKGSDIKRTIDFVNGINTQPIIGEKERFLLLDFDWNYIFSKPTDKSLYTRDSIELYGGVEKGGYLSTYTIDEESRCVHRYDNNVYEEEPFDKKKRKGIITTDEDLKKIVGSQFSLLKEQGDNTTSLILKEPLFREERWKEYKLLIRGLFLRGRTDEVKARGYNKFFNLYTPNAQSQHISPFVESEHTLNSLEYPVTVAEKIDGYLGIISYDVDQDRLEFYSKNSKNSDHAEYLRELWLKEDKTLTDKIEEMIKLNNCSMIVECVTPMVKNQIDYGNEESLYILDFIPNQLRINGSNVDVAFSDELKFSIVNLFSHVRSPKILKLSQGEQVDSISKLVRLLREVKSDSNSEGVVVTDSKGFMFKFKTDWYFGKKYGD